MVFSVFVSGIVDILSSQIGCLHHFTQNIIHLSFLSFWSSDMIKSFINLFCK